MKFWNEFRDLGPATDRCARGLVMTLHWYVALGGGRLRRMCWAAVIRFYARDCRSGFK